jgi:1-acyl-sn-glycerol-3-phosphate acyltransferase
MTAPEPLGKRETVGQPLAATKRARRITPPTGWQFSRPASVAREVTARVIGPFIAWFLAGPRVLGWEHLDALEGPSLICPTHASHFDFSAIRLALGPRHRNRLTAAAAADYFAMKRSRWLVAAWLGAFAFNRTGRGADSIAAAEGLLAAGWHVVMFPEGTRTMTGEINPFQPGIGLLARHTGRQVLPVRIVGIRGVLPKGARRPRRSPVEVRFGAPIRAMPGEDARAFTARLETIVRAL